MSFHFSKSFFGLIEVISTGTGLYSSDLIRLILNEKRESLLSGLDYYEKSSIKSEENLINDSLIHNKKIKDSFNYILTSLRKLLNFKNEKTSLKLLNQFFIYKNFLSPATDINKTLENESNPLTAFILNFNESKLNEICFYYFDEERMGYLKFLNCILRVVEDEDHLYYTVVKEILVDDLLEVNDNINKQPLLYQLLEQFISLCNSQISVEFEQDRWALCFLVEQKAILEVIVSLVYTLVFPQPKDIIKIYKTFRDYNFGLKQKNKVFFDFQAFKVLNEVTNLSILISISSLNLENLLIKNMLNQLEEHPLFKDVNILVEILGFTNDFYSEKNYFFGVDQVETKIVGPLFIAISCLLMKLIELVPEQIPQRYLKIFEMIKGVDQNGSKILSTFPSKLVEQAYNLDAIQYITRTLDTSLYKVEENSSTIYRSILKGLLTIFFYYYQLNRLPHFEQTILCLSKIFNQDENICIQFWEEDVKLLGQTTFLEVNLNRFPSSLTTFLVLIKNMIGGELSASKIFYYLGSVNTFTDFFSTEDVTGLDRAPNQPLNVNSQGRCYWKNAGRGLVHGSSSSMNLYMPEGTEGVVVSGRDFTNNTVRIQFFYNYSIWHLFISFLDSFLKTTEKVKTQDNTNHAATIETITMIMEIFYALLINSSTTLFKLFLEHTERFPTRKILEKNYFFNYLVKILTRCCEFSQPPLKLLTVVINVTSIFLTDGVNDERELFWEQFRNETFFLPRYSKVSLLNKENNKNTISFDDNNFFQTESFFQNILLPAEKRLGKYSATLSFLTLVLDFVLTLNNGFHKSKNDLSIDESKLEAINFCLIFIQKEIFSTFCDWRYVDVNEKVLIGLAIFTIFNTVFNFNCSRLTFAKDYLTEKFLSFGSETIAEKKQSLKGATGVYQVLPIVNLVGIGMKTLEYYFRLSSSTGKNFESLILESLRFLNKLLTILKYKRILNNEKRVSILEHSVLDRTTAYGINNQKEIVFVIASYIHYDYNLELPLEATNCLTLLIECSSAWENVRPPSFLGLFGENCLDTVKCFVQLALQDKGSIKFYDQNATIRDNLKAAIFKFCTAVVEYQPGLARLILNGKHDGPAILTEKNNFENNETPNGFHVNSILHAVLNSFDQDFETKFERNPVVFTSIFKFLEVLFKKAPEYNFIYQKLINNKTLNIYFEKIFEFDIPKPEIYLNEIQFDDIEENITGAIFEKLPPSNYHENVKLYCNKLISISHVLKILGLQVFYKANQKNADQENFQPLNLIPALKSSSLLTNLLKKIFFKKKLLNFFKENFEEIFFKYQLNYALERISKIEGVYFNLNNVYNNEPLKTDLHEFRNIYTTLEMNFGDQFFYNLDDLVAKFDIDILEETESAVLEDLMDVSENFQETKKNFGLEFLFKVLEVNLNLSLSDAQLQFLKSFKFFVELVCLKFGYILFESELGNEKGRVLNANALTEKHSKSDNKPKITQVENLYEFINLIFKSLNKDENKSNALALVRFKTELSDMLVFFIKFWMDTFNIEPTDSDLYAKYTSKFVTILEHYCDSLVLEEGFFGGNIAELNIYHRSLFNGLFLTLQKFGKVVGNSKQIAEDSNQELYLERIFLIFSIILEALLSQLKKLEQYYLNFNKAYLEEEEFKNFQILVSIFIEILKIQFGINKNNEITSKSFQLNLKFLNLMEKLNVINLILRLLQISFCLYEKKFDLINNLNKLKTTDNFVNFTEDSNLEFNPSKDEYIKQDVSILISFDIFRLLITLASYHQTAELLARNDILTTLSDNSFSPIFVNGIVSPYIGQKRNPLHKIWCLILSVINELTYHLLDSSLFMNQVTTILTLFWNQIRKSLDLSEDSNFTIGSLEETEKITQVFYSFGKHISNLNKKEQVGVDIASLKLLDNLKQKYLNLSSNALKYFAYFFSHPNIFKSKIVNLADVGGTNENFGHVAINVDADNTEIQVVFNQIKELMFISNRYIVNYILLITDGENTLYRWKLSGCRIDDSGGYIENLIFNPSLTQTTDYLGNDLYLATLFDLTNFAQELLSDTSNLSKISYLNKIKFTQILQFMESNFLLIFSQIVTFFNLSEVNIANKLEVFNELGQDLEGSLTKVRSKVNKIFNEHLEIKKFFKEEEIQDFKNFLEIFTDIFNIIKKKYEEKS